mmetsp:Transcript_741/g.1278  ORF Transcript_741/g.1278 Transcript_741/m.1278 type:complete len:128 (+) Transcript_741:47-430(+)
MLAVGGWDKKVVIYNTDADVGTKIMTLHRNGWVSAVSFSRNGQILAVGGWDCAALVYQVATGTEICNIIFNGNWVSSLSFTPDGSHLAVGGWGESTRKAAVYDIVTGDEVFVLNREDDVLAVAYSMQ